MASHSESQYRSNRVLVRRCQNESAAGIEQSVKSSEGRPWILQMLDYLGGDDQIKPLLQLELSVEILLVPTRSRGQRLRLGKYICTCQFYFRIPLVQDTQEFPGACPIIQ